MICPVQQGVTVHGEQQRLRISGHVPSMPAAPAGRTDPGPQARIAGVTAGQRLYTGVMIALAKVWKARWNETTAGVASSSTSSLGTSMACTTW